MGVRKVCLHPNLMTQGASPRVKTRSTQNTAVLSHLLFQPKIALRQNMHSLQLICVCIPGIRLFKSCMQFIDIIDLAYRVRCCLLFPDFFFFAQSGVSKKQEVDTLRQIQLLLIIMLQKIAPSFNHIIHFIKIVICKCRYTYSSRWYLIWSQDPLVIHVVRMDITRMKPYSLQTPYCGAQHIH